MPISVKILQNRMSHTNSSICLGSASASTKWTTPKRACTDLGTL
jgi:hypothetical protein